MGPDKLMRSDSYLEPEFHTVEASLQNPESGSVDTEAGNQALSGKAGQSITDDYRGIKVLSAYVPLKFYDTTYALIAEIDEAEAFKAIVDLRNLTMVVAAAAIATMLLASLAIADWFTKPIITLTSSSTAISAGELDKEIGVSSNDELGILARSFDTMRQAIRDKISDLDAEIERRRKAQEELRVHRDHLEEMVEERTAELQASQAELTEAKNAAENANRAKGDFLANMSHEIRTPMNAIIGLGHLVQKTELTTKQQDYISKIHSSSHSLLGIINDILDFSKIEAGKLDMESIDFDLNRVFDNLSNLISMKAREKCLELVFVVASDVPAALIGDPLRLGQVLSNLANNALKFTEKGEVVVRASLVEESDREVCLEFAVGDTGIGLAEEQRSTLFQAFSQADTSTTRKYGGTGLGLSISKGLVEMMGGEIGVESELDVGSTFYFTARFGLQSASKIRKKKIIPAELQDLKVLIVDDN